MLTKLEKQILDQCIELSELNCPHYYVEQLLPRFKKKHPHTVELSVISLCEKGYLAKETSRSNSVCFKLAYSTFSYRELERKSRIQFAICSVIVPIIVAAITAVITCLITDFLF